MSDNRIEFWRNEKMDLAIEDVIDIFTNVDGVELVRLSGMTKRFSTISQKVDIPKIAVDNIIRKLNNQNIIDFKYVIKCKHCGEISYVVKYNEEFLIKPKLCDTCSTFYHLDTDSLETIIKKQP
ncbi:hypothetical protein D3C87_80620 [compost metagenome]